MLLSSAGAEASLYYGLPLEFQCCVRRPGLLQSVGSAELQKAAVAVTFGSTSVDCMKFVGYVLMVVVEGSLHSVLP